MVKFLKSWIWCPNPRKSLFFHFFKSRVDKHFVLRCSKKFKFFFKKVEKSDFWDLYDISPAYFYKNVFRKYWFRKYWWPKNFFPHRFWSILVRFLKGFSLFHFLIFFCCPCNIALRSFEENMGFWTKTTNWSIEPPETMLKNMAFCTKTSICG